jgi:hypothetical protein
MVFLAFDNQGRAHVKNRTFSNLPHSRAATGLHLPSLLAVDIGDDQGQDPQEHSPSSSKG